MYREELTRTIIDRLSAAANRDDTIRYVCQRGNLTWPEASAMVADVEETYSLEIERRHIPINLTSAFMVWLFGALVLTYAVLSIFEPLLGRPLPDFLYILNDFGVRNGLLPDTTVAVENLHRFGLLPDSWRTLYTLGQTYGVSRDVINILYVLASGYLFWPFLLMGVSSLVVGSLEFFKNIFRLAGR